MLIIGISEFPEADSSSNVNVRMKESDHSLDRAPIRTATGDFNLTLHQCSKRELESRQELSIIS
jgi:hypothetical protein